MKNKTIFKTIYIALLTASLVLSGCGGKNQTGSNASGNAASATDGADTEKPAASSLEDTMAQWGKNSEAVKQRHMQELYMALQPMWANEGKYPSAWNMSDFYPDQDAFMADYDAVMKWIGTLGGYKGTLDCKENIYNYFTAIEDEEMNEKYNTMLLYCELGESLDMKDDYYRNLNEKLKKLENDFSKATSYAQEEIMSLPYEERIEIFEDPDFDPMDYMLSYYTLEEANVFSAETKNAVADLMTAQGGGKDAYELFRYMNMPAAQIQINGREVALTDDVYASIVESAMDRDTKVNAYKAYTQNFGQYADMYASFLQTTVSEKWAQAKVYGYDTTLEMALADENLDGEIFTKVIKAAGDAAPAYARYLELHRQALGLTDQYMFDLKTLASDCEEPVFAFDDTIDMLKEAVSVLGNDYTAILDDIVTNGSIDAASSENRDKSTYCMAAGKINYPHVFINYYGEYVDASNLAHELGHAVNYKMVGDTQPVWYTDVSIFDTEVCSIMHELLLNAYLVQNAASDQEKLYYLERLLDIYDSSFFSQCMYTELEDYMYKTVEGGNVLTGEGINSKMAELFKKYRGTALETEDVAWMGVDHLHYCYYMYKYATSVSYASALAGEILGGNEKVIDSYKKFMSAGSSDSPQNLIKLAGIDPLADKTYKDAAEYYSSLVDEYEQLLKATGKVQ